MASSVWLITGASSGFGLLLSLKALRAGHRVLAAMRNPAKSPKAVSSIEAAGGQVIILDMTDSQADLRKKIQEVEKEFGAIEVLVNNAGYSELGAIELFTDTETENQMRTNFFGPMYITQAVIPGMRARRSGTIVNVSSVAGQDANPSCGIYSASKFALEGFSEALSKELKEFNISVLIVEPGAFRTNFLQAAGVGEIPGYEGTAVGHATKLFVSANGKQPGDPEKGANIIYEVVTGEGAAGHLKGNILRLPLGKDSFARIQKKLDTFQHDMDSSRDVATATDFS